MKLPGGAKKGKILFGTPITGSERSRLSYLWKLQTSAVEPVDTHGCLRPSSRRATRFLKAWECDRERSYGPENGSRISRVEFLQMQLEERFSIAAH